MPRLTAKSRFAGVRKAEGDLLTDDGLDLFATKARLEFGDASGENANLLGLFDLASDDADGFVRVFGTSDAEQLAQLVLVERSGLL